MKTSRPRILAASLLACVLSIAVGVPSAMADPPAGTVTVSGGDLTGLVGEPLTAEGTTSVADPTGVATEVENNGSWTTSQTGSVTSDAFSVPVSYAQTTAGTSTWRVRVDSAAGSVYSDTFTVTRLSTTPVVVSAPTTVATDITGQVAVSVPNVKAGTSVSTQFLINGSWSTSQSAKTDASGAATLPLTWGSKTPGTYTWRISSTNEYGVTSVTSSHTLTRVSAAPTVVSAPSKVTTDIPGTVSGTVAQVGAGQRVWVQFLLKGTWTGSSYGATNAGGQVSIPLTYGKTTPGSYTWRLATYRSGAWYASSSHTLTRLTAYPVILSATSSAIVGHSASVKVKIENVGAGQRVWTQFYSKGTWTTSQIKTTNSSGQVEIPLTYGSSAAGTYTWRVVTTRHGVTFASGSRTLVRTKVYLDGRCTSGRAICVDKTARKVYWVVNGKILKTLDARFAGPGYTTPTGAYNVYRKVYLNISHYNNAKMPFSLFYQGGRAVHYSYGFAAQGWNGGSHGCVNLRDWAGSEWLYNQARIGDKVIIYTH